MTKSRIVALIAAGSLTAFAAACGTASNDNNMNANANKAANTAMNQNAAANNANSMAQNANAKAANANANAKAANANAKAAPSAKVVKTLNIVNCEVMIEPAKGGHPTMLLCGNDAGAKKQVTELLKSMGWRDIMDLGDITKARGTEMLLPLWLNLFGLFGNPHFGFKVVHP